MSNANICERAADLIGFLYGEVSEIEARRFERHLGECAACAAEFTAFGQIRESMVEWRNESLGLTGVPIVAAAPKLATSRSQSRMPAKSALAALREFFALSPFWMKGATALAAVLFCVCAVLAVSYMKSRPYNSTVVNANGGAVYSAQEWDRQLAIAVAKATKEMGNKEQKPPEQAGAIPPAPKKSVDRLANSPRPAYATTGNPRRPFSRQERQELATDLRLVSSKDDDDLDFTIDSNRPTP